MLSFQTVLENRSDHDRGASLLSSVRFARDNPATQVIPPGYVSPCGSCRKPEQSISLFDHIIRDRTSHWDILKDHGYCYQISTILHV